MNVKPVSYLLHRSLLRRVWVMLSFVPAIAWGQQTPTAAGATVDKDDKVIELSPFSVTAKSDASGYGVTSTTSMTRLNTPLREIPQTINIVSEQFMKELAAPTLGEAVAFMPNVTTRTGAPDRFQVRSIDVFSQFRNSFRYGTGDSLDYVKDLTNVERIEIIKGLGSATTGRGEAGGVINLITKKPQTKPMTSIKGLVDGFGYYKAELDNTGPLTKSGSVLYRASASYAGGETYSPNVKYDTFSFYPSLEFRFTNRTNLLIEGSLQSGETPAAELFELPDWRQGFKRGTNGVIVSPVPADRTLTVLKMLSLRHPQTLPWLKPDAQVYELTASLNHKFTDWLSTRQAVLFFKGEIDREFTRLSGLISGEAGWVFDPKDTAKIAPIDMNFALQYTLAETDSQFTSYQGDFLLDFKGTSVANQTLIGYEYTDRSVFYRFSRSQDNRGFRVIDNSAFLNLKRGDLLPRPVTANTDRDRTESSVYIQHAIKLWRDRLQFLGGWRYDDLEEDIRDIRNNTLTKSRPAATKDTYRIGGSFRVLPWLTAFAVHAEQKDPKTTVLRFPQGTFGVASRDPKETISAERTVKLDEIGIKSEVLGGRLTFNLTYYDILEGSNIRGNNFRTNPQDNVSPLYNWTENLVDPSGTSAGYEIEIMGAPTERLSFYASASFPTNETLLAVQADGSIIKSFRRGHSDARLNFAGNYLVSNKGNYSVYAQNAFGWVDDVVLNPDNKILQGGSLRWDLGVRVVHRAQRGSWEAQARVQNVLDQRITTGTGNSGTSPRRYSFSLERRF